MQSSYAFALERAVRASKRALTPSHPPHPCPFPPCHPISASTPLPFPSLPPHLSLHTPTLSLPVHPISASTPLPLPSLSIHPATPARAIRVLPDDQRSQKC
ncbi:hypothetical protein Pmani_023101 [Petrolisthes manimaculis]|uniref:Uncharacterized protein n=1 Tax=Petrolisthes manimaculis TaxID=1843537 RepID=A0AAE1PCK7_9EUCA|nr:hypothetical protein Pmani_023101 [Petrolisthes manimaculis]